MPDRMPDRHGRSVLVPLWSALFPALLHGFVPVSGAAAQNAPAQNTPVRGLVRNAAGLPLEGVQASVAATPAIAVSDERGEFTIVAATTGPVMIRVRRLGFRPESAAVVLATGKTAEVKFTLQRIAVDLAPVTVVGRREVVGPMSGFYRRRASSAGRFFTREEIDRRNAARMSDLLRMVPGLRVQARGMQNSVRIRGSRCAPFIWLDGAPLSAMEFDLDSSDPTAYEGIEVYSGPASVPVEFQGNRATSSSCGTIVLWTRRGSLRNARITSRDNAAAQKVAAMVERSAVFLEDQVDVKAGLDTALIVRPIYPDAMFDGGVPGQVLAEFVVSTSGEVLLETFSVVIASDRAFVEPVRRAVKDQRFTPAMRRGAAVQQVMQLPFSFVPDSTARRKR